MKLYKLNNEVYQEPLPNGFDIKNAVEITSPIREDGTIYKTHPNLAKLERKEDGSLYTYYLLDGSDKPDLAKEQEAVDTATKVEADKLKVEALEAMTVTIGSGKVFYADAASRVDMASAIDGAKLKAELGAPVTEVLWKLAEPYEGSKVVNVTLLEIREASALALERKAEIVGAIAKESV